MASASEKVSETNYRPYWERSASQADRVESPSSPAPVSRVERADESRRSEASVREPSDRSNLSSAARLLVDSPELRKAAVEASKRLAIIRAESPSAEQRVSAMGGVVEAFLERAGELVASRRSAAKDDARAADSKLASDTQGASEADAKVKETKPKLSPEEQAAADAKVAAEAREAEKKARLERIVNEDVRREREPWFRAFRSRNGSSPASTRQAAAE